MAADDPSPVVAPVDPLVWQLPVSRAQESRWPYQVLYGLAAEFDGVHAAHALLRNLLREAQDQGDLPHDVAGRLARVEYLAVPIHDTSELIATIRQQGLTDATDALQAAQYHRIDALQILRERRDSYRSFGRLLAESTVPPLRRCLSELARAGAAVAMADRRTLDAMPTLGHPTLTPPALRSADRDAARQAARDPSRGLSL